MKKFSLPPAFYILIFCLSQICFADLASQISKQINASDQKKVQYGICITEAATGKKVFTQNHTTALIPASNMKLVTSAAALHYLGSDYVYETKLGLCGTQLVIIGSGDPLLGDEKTLKRNNLPQFYPIDDIVSLIKNENLTEITNIITDTSIFEDKRVHPFWPVDQLNQWYACEVSGLNFNDNCIDIRVWNNKGSLVYATTPQTGFLKIINQAKTTSKKKNLIGAYRSPQENVIYLKGYINKSAEFTVAIERPAGFFAYYLAEKLLNSGIRLTGQIIEGPTPKDCTFKLLKTYQTPISDVLLRCNQDSLGLAAEAMLKTIAAAENPSGKLGSWQVGAQRVSEYLGELGISDDQFKIDDGCGLSRNNRLSAGCLVAVLQDIYKDEKKKSLILPSLSVGGVSGTASKWFTQEKYKGKILLKTGYINGVRSYTGVCKTNNGDFLFSVITNNSNGKSRKAMNEILQAIIDNYD